LGDAVESLQVFVIMLKKSSKTNETASSNADEVQKVIKLPDTSPEKSAPARLDSSVSPVVPPMSPVTPVEKPTVVPEHLPRLSPPVGGEISQDIPYGHATTGITEGSTPQEKQSPHHEEKRSHYEEEHSRDEHEPNKWAHFLTGAVTFAIVFFLCRFVDHSVTPPKLWAYTQLHSAVSALDRTRTPQVTVIDINPIPGPPQKPTSREHLLQILEALKPLKPATIGIDVDFSPNEENDLVTGDDTFFNLIRGYSKGDNKQSGIPVFLGVGRRAREENPSNWLGIPDLPSAKNSDLAAGLPVLAETRLLIPRYMLPEKEETAVAPQGHKESTGSKHEGLITLSYALAREYARYTGKPLPAPNALTSHMVQNHSEAKVGGETLAATFVNYSKMEEIRREAILLTSNKKDYAAILEANKSKIQGRVVILGDLNDANDTFDGIPGHVGKHPGVLLHAASTYSLIQEPFYEPKEWILITQDIFLTVLSLFLGWLIQLGHYLKKHPLDSTKKTTPIVRLAIALYKKHPFNPEKADIAMTIGTAIFLFLLAWLCAFWFHVVWLGIFIAMPALLLHLGLSQVFHQGREKIQARRQRNKTGTKITP
jgi:hypothetical protein